MKILVNPYFSADKSFRDHYISYRVEDIDFLGSNIVQVFVANYLNYILSENIFDFNFIKREENMLKELLAGNSGKGQLRFQEYAQWELAQDHDMHDDKIEMYRRFLEKNDSYFHSLDILSSDFKLSPNLEGVFFELIVTELSRDLFIEEVEKFINFLILYTRFSLLCSMTYSEELNFNNKKAQILNFHIIKNELTLGSISIQKNSIGLLREAINKVHKEFVTKAVINDRLKIFDFIHNEIDVLETDLGLNELNRDNAKNQETTSVINDFSYHKLDKELDYPKHIFKDEQSYMLFHTIAEEMTKPAQLSFLFRQMSEAEKPAMIICRDAVFREWFNTEGYSLELENVTKRLSDASTADRLTFYQLAKKLLHINN